MNVFNVHVAAQPPKADAADALGIDGVKSNFHSEIKIVEREYITILGIFAAIVLAFVGTFTFSTSVLNNIGQAHFGKILIVACLIFVAFYEIISLLVNFLREINGRATTNNKFLRFGTIIFILGTIAGMCVMRYWDNMKIFIINFFM